MSKKLIMGFIAVVSMGLMTLSLNANEMKCGAGKCGASMSKDTHTKKNCDNPDCAAKKDSSKPCDCDHKKMKCGAGKCGKSSSNNIGDGKCGK